MMRTISLFLLVFFICSATSLRAADNDKVAKSYQQIEFKELARANPDVDGKAITMEVGLGPISQRPCLLVNKGIDPNKYVTIEIRVPGKTKENEKDKIDAYILKDSIALEMYNDYGTGTRLRNTWQEDSAVTVWGTIHHVLPDECFPVVLVIDKIEPTHPWPKGNLRYSITVTRFDNKANWSGRWNLGDGFKEIMTNALHESGWFIVLGDKEMRSEAMQEQDFAASGRAAGGKKAPKIARMTPAQLLVKGAITHVQHGTLGGGGGISIRGISVGGSKSKAEVNITIYLVDSETGQVKASTKVIGKSHRKGVRLGYSRGGFGGGGRLYKNDNMGKACEDAVAQAVDFLIKQLEDIPWEGTVLLAKNDNIVINRGSREGVRVGTVFVVGGIEELVDEDTGEVLDSEMTRVGTLEVTKVKEKIAYCKAIEGGDAIKKGMTILIPE